MHSRARHNSHPQVLINSNRERCPRKSRKNELIFVRWRKSQLSAFAHTKIGMTYWTVGDLTDCEAARAASRALITALVFSSSGFTYVGRIWVLWECPSS
jgi:hypothetical protein